MERVLDKIYELKDRNATHLKSGHRFNEGSMDAIIDHMGKEVQELKACPGDILELADILCIALHVVERNNWTLDQVYDAMLYKLKIRFDSVEVPYEHSKNEIPLPS